MLVGSEYVYVIRVVDISSCEINLGEICGKCLFFLVACSAYLLCLDAQLLVVGHGHGAAGIICARLLADAAIRASDTAAFSPR